MSDTQAAPDDRNEIDAIGVDPDFVTNDHHPEPDEAAPAEEESSDGDDDDVDVADLP
jgi:hypothetical protein